MIAILPIILGVIGFFYFHGQTKTYQASSSLLFSQNVAQQIVSGSTSGSSTSTLNIATEAAIITSGDTPELTAAQIGGGLSGADVSGMISVAGSENSDVVNVVATSTSPTLAARVANVYASQFVRTQNAHSAESYKAGYVLVTKEINALSSAERRSAAGLGLTARAQTLQVLSQLPSGGVSVLDEAGLPGAAISPKVGKDTLIVAVVGLLAGIALAFLLEVFDPVVRDDREFEEVYGLPLLAKYLEAPGFCDLAEETSPNRRASQRSRPRLFISSMPNYATRLWIKTPV